MNQFDLQDLLKFAEYNHLTKLPFQQVYQLWQKDIQEIVDSQQADDYTQAEEYLACI